LWLDVAGGEPFLLDELPELVAPFDCEVLGIPTNGHDPDKITRLTRGLLIASKARDVVISVSIEGFEEDHTDIRRNKRNYELAFETLRALRELSRTEKRLKVKCNSVLTDTNADRMVDFMKFMRESDLIDFHSIILLRGDPYEPTVGLPTLERLRELRPQIFEILDSYLWGCGTFKRRFLRKYYQFLWDVSLGNIETGSQVIPCTGGQTHLVIWANGNVAPCELTPSFGNIHEQRLPEILAGQRRKDEVAKIKRKECSCTHNCVMLDSILFNPMSYPKLLNPIG
jgi:MoaA/NifB/PqqE/SkfB family radical SAM enzyme